MLDRELLSRIRGLDEHDLRRLLIFARGLLSARHGHELREPKKRGKITYRQERVKCGREGCTRCPHGPYWYAYWRESGRMRSRYIGKDLTGVRPTPE
jgi:hypothetical protein